MMFKKFLALFLALMTIAFCFVSCDSDKDEPTQTTAATTTAEATTTAAPFPPAAPIYKIKLSDFVIVHTDERHSRLSATYLQTLIEEKTGVLVTTTNKYEESDSYKILIGNFNLEATNAFFEKDAKYLEKYYEVVFQDNLVIIATADKITAESACVSLVEKTMEANVDTMSISNDFSYIGDFYGHAEIGFNSRVDENDIRIVSFNIANYIEPVGRMKNLFKLVEFFEADVIQFQEAVGTYNWHDVIDTTLLNTYDYAEAPTNRSGFTHDKNPLPIFYKKEKLELINSEYHNFTYPNSGGRAFSLAEFKVKETSKTFTCICSHFSTVSAENMQNQEEISDFVTNYLSSHNNAPVFLLGDLNAEKKQLGGKIKGVMTHALDMKDIVKKNTEYGTSCVVTGVWPGNWLREDGHMIDHALGAGSGYIGKQFQVVASKRAAATSDHVPIIFDFELT